MTGQKRKPNRLKRILIGLPIVLVVLFLAFVGYRYLRVVSTDIQELSIDMSDEDWKFTDSLNQDVLRVNVVKSSHKQYVPAVLSLDGKEVKVKMRLKGDKMDHYTTKPPSYRVKVKGGETVFGTNKFSLQAVECRNFPMEWLFHKLMASQDVLSLHMDIVKLNIKGINVITTFEEHFTHHLTERFDRPRGIIMCINENRFWDEFYGCPSEDQERDLFENGPIKIMNDGGIKDSTVINRAVSFLDGLRKGTMTADEVVDIRKMAMYYAIAELTYAHHSLRWHNTRYFYNSTTDKLEPIGFDGSIALRRYRSVYEDGFVKEFNKGRLFASPAFVKEYLKCIDLVSSEEFLDSFVENNGEEIDEMLSKVYAQQLLYTRGTGWLYRNAECVREHFKTLGKKICEERGVAQST